MSLIACFEIIAKALFPNIKKNKHISSILIPHAGLEYSGLASVIPFLEINTNNYSKVICLCTNHYTTTNIEITSKDLLSVDVRKIVDREHSYLRMEEIVEHFFNKNGNTTQEIIYHLIGDHTSSNALNSVDENTLIIANSDFWHYGDRFSNSQYSSKINSQHDKILKENAIIKAIKESDIDSYNEATKDDTNIKPCGNHVIKLLLKYHSDMNITGEVCMYHDSVNTFLPSFNILDMMKLDHNGSEHLVSYVSIIFSKYNHVSALIRRFEQLMLLSRIKSIVEFIITDKSRYTDLIIMPEWCNINSYKNGIFVGIKNIEDNATRASIGYYSTDNFVKKTLAAAKSCVNDALNRWKKPILMSEISPHNKIMYYVNIFEEEGKWKTWHGYQDISKNAPGKDITKKKYGYKFSYNRNGLDLSSTYLPGVWKEHEDRWSTFEKMINDLIYKALSKVSCTDDELKEYKKNGLFKTYKTTYVEEPIITDKLVCFR